MQKEKVKNEKAAPILHNLSFVGYEVWISFTVSLVYSFFQEQILHKTDDSMNEIQKVIFLAGSRRTSSKKDIVCWVMTMTVTVKALRPEKHVVFIVHFGKKKLLKRKKIQLLVLWRHNNLKDYVFAINLTNSVLSQICYAPHDWTQRRELALLLHPTSMPFKWGEPVH